MTQDIMETNATIGAEFFMEIDAIHDHTDGRWRVHHGKGPWWDDIEDGVEIEKERDDCYYVYEWPSGRIMAIIPALHPEILTPELILRQFKSSRNLVDSINQMIYEMGDNQ